MKITKFSAFYDGRFYNLLPAVLLTPLYGHSHTPRGGGITEEVYFYCGQRPLSGFRLSLKFWRWHTGVEVHGTLRELFRKPGV
jgi:hypothetical protein